MDDLAKQILLEEQQRTRQLEWQQQQNANLQRYTAGVISQFNEVCRIILDSVKESNKALPAHLQIFTGTLNQQAHTLLIVRNERFIALQLDRINSEGWLGLCFSNGNCLKTMSSGQDRYDIQLCMNAYQLCLWAQYAPDGSQFKWTYSVPRTCSHKTWCLPPYDTRCDNCGAVDAGSFTNEQIAQFCLTEFGKAKAPRPEFSPARAYTHFPQQCRYRTKPEEGPCVGP